MSSVVMTAVLSLLLGSYCPFSVKNASYCTEAFVKINLTIFMFFSNLTKVKCDCLWITNNFIGHRSLPGYYILQMSIIKTKISVSEVDFPKILDLSLNNFSMSSEKATLLYYLRDKHVEASHQIEWTAGNSSEYFP